jgi:hypothetical protein
MDKENLPDRDKDITGYKKIDRYNPELIESLSVHYKDVLLQLGEDPMREGLLKTPERMAKAALFLTHGYDLDAKSILESAMFKEEYSQMVVVKDIEVYSMCEHHMLPFFGKAHICIHTQRLCLRTEQNTARGGCLCPPFAGAGTVDQRNTRLHTQYAAALGSGRGY